MRRRLLIGGLTALALTLVLIGSLFIYVRSGRLDRFLETQIVRALADVGIRAEIGRAHLELNPYRVSLDDLKLYTEGNPKPFGTVGRIEAAFSVIDYLKQDLTITEVRVIDPRLTVNIDSQGRSELQSLHAPPHGAGGHNGDVDVLGAILDVENGEVTVNDQSRNLSVAVPGISVTYLPNHSKPVEDEPNGTVQLAFGNGAVEYDGKWVRDITSKATGTVARDAAELSDLTLTSSLGQASVNGRILSFDPLKYDLKVKSSVSIARASQLIDSRSRLTGIATLEGAAEGAGADYHLTASLTSSSLGADGIRIDGLRMNTNVQGSGEAYKATAQFQTGGAESSQAQVGRTDMGLTVTGSGARPSAAGSLSLASIQTNGVTFSDLRGKLEANRERIALTDFSSEFLGGEISGSASAALSGGTSTLDVAFKSIDLGQAAELASTKAVTVTGSANGTAKLSFPRLDYHAATGRVDASFDAAVSRPQHTPNGSVPATGQISLNLTSGGINVEEALIHSGNSDVTATGSIDWAGNASITADFNSQDMADVQQSIDAIGLIPDVFSDKYHVQLAGPGVFAGHVGGSLSQPALEGHVNFSQIKSQDQNVGALTADIKLSPESFSFDNASLDQPDGTRAQFSLYAPFDGGDDISVKASLTDFDLAALARIADPDLADIVSRGIITGRVELGGLPGPRTIIGTADISLSGAEFNIPAMSETSTEPTRMSVPEFAGGVTFKDSTLTVDNLRMRIGDSQLSGQFSFNLDTYAYAVKAEGKNLDLSQMAQALTDNAPVTGVADVVVTGQGNWKDWSTMTLDSSIQGRGVAYGGRDFGDARIVARTDNGVVKIDASGKVLDTPRTVEATIDLKDSDNYTLSANVDFSDQDIGPYLGLISPQLASVLGKATGSIKLGGPLSNPDKVQAVARLAKLEVGGAVSQGRHYAITNQGDVVLTATADALTLSPVTFTGEGTKIALGGTIGRDAGTKTDFKIDGTMNLQLISSFSQIIYTTGIAQLQASIVGSLNSPRLTGSADLKDVGVQIADLPFSISRGKGQIRFTENQAAIENFVATTPGGGNLTIRGGASLADLVPDRWRVEVAAAQVGVDYPRDTQTVFDGNLVFQGNRQLQVLSGDLKVRRASYLKDVTMAELIATGGPFGSKFVETGPGGNGSAGGPGPKVNIDLRVDADQTLLVRDNLADAIGSAHLQVRGPISDPIVSGRVLFTRGTIEFLNDRYEINRWLMTFPGTRGAEPYIDMRAETDISGYRVTISLSGPPSKLHTVTSSDPALPENELVALILTGRPTLDNTEAQTNYAASQTGLGLAQTLLSATLSEQLERQTQRLFGLNRFSIDPLIAGRSADPTARVTLGQKITNDFTVTYSQNLTAGPEGLERIALVEYRLSNKFSIVGLRDETGSIGFNIRVRKRF
jgi:translocation and assembly module TamB